MENYYTYSNEILYQNGKYQVRKVTVNDKKPKRYFATMQYNPSTGNYVNVGHRKTLNAAINDCQF